MPNLPDQTPGLPEAVLRIPIGAAVVLFAMTEQAGQNGREQPPGPGANLELSVALVEDKTEITLPHAFLTPETAGTEAIEPTLALRAMEPFLPANQLKNPSPHLLAWPTETRIGELAIARGKTCAAIGYAAVGQISQTQLAQNKQARLVSLKEVLRDDGPLTLGPLEVGLVQLGLASLRGSMDWRIVSSRADSHQSTRRILARLLPPEFTMSQLRKVFEEVQGEPIDAANFRRIRTWLKLVSTGGKVMTGGLPAEVFRLPKRAS